jgi:YtkA-like
VMLFLLMIVGGIIAWGQAHTHNPTSRTAGEFEVTLKLPPSGLAAGAEQTIEFQIINLTSKEPVTGAIARALLTMPAMPGMSNPESPASTGGKPGDYRVHLKFAHSGDYLLVLKIAPPADKPFTLDFPLTITNATESHGLIMPSSFGTGTMSRQGTGTSWLPEATPMYAFMKHYEEWMIMAHASAFLTFIHQSGKLGDQQLVSTNWLMGSAQRSVWGLTKAGRGTLLVRSMLSFDDLTTGGRGYPLLLQTGETYQGEAITNRQHPHDFIMELAAAYSAPLSKTTVLSVYAAPVGEPALGPPAFMHRLSAIDNPEAPLGHHWQDSTHVTSGVVTLGLAQEKWKIEGSVFTGREPDENRWDIDQPRFDSWSARFWLNPHPSWSFQVSYGFLRSPEALQPLVDQRRVTASATYHRMIGDKSYSATTFVWGRNIKNERGYSGFSMDSFLIESTYSFGGRRSLFTRFERVEKDDLFGDAHVHGQYADIHTVHRFSLGGVENLPIPGPFDLGLGASFGIPVIPPGTEFVFGKNLYSASVFLRFRIRNTAGRHSSANN